MSKETAYLVIHKVALYNDEFYNDHTTSSEIANPTGLFDTRSAAETHLRELSRQTLRGADSMTLQLDEETLYRADQLYRGGTQGSSSPELTELFRQILDGDPLPDTLTDTQADTIIDLLDLKLFYVLENELDPAQMQEAQTILKNTPERPAVSPDYDDESGETTYHCGHDPAAERLERVTQLFGRHYATEEGY